MRLSRPRCRLSPGIVHLLSLLLLLLCGTPAAAPQASRVSGVLSGTVADASGLPIASATVVVTSESGARRTIAAGATGRFSVFNLPSGTYSVRASAPGFADYTADGITLAVGRNTALDIRLRSAGSEQTVRVTAAGSALDPNQTSPVVNVDRDRVEELPIPSRNYLTFTLLAPEVAPANPAIAQQTLGGGGNSGFSFGGLRPNSNAVYIDGVGDNDEYTGGSRTELSPEAISDFQIVNHGFAAESGGADGGSIDVQTRSGVDLQHGDAFIFVQNGALNGTNPLELVPRKPDENRLRVGLSTGGALVPDKTFYYLAAEQEIAQTEDANDLAPQTLASVNQALRRQGPLPSLFLRGGFIPVTEEETELSGRADHTFSPRESLMARYALTNTRNVNEAFNTDDLTDRSARGSSFIADNSLNGALASDISASLLNRLSLEGAQRRVVLRTPFASGPGVLVSGLAQFGTPYAGNSLRYETYAELNDTLLAQRRSHLFAFGVGLDHIALRADDRDGFAGLYVFPGLSALQSATPSFYTQAFGDPDTNFAETRIDAFAQDHWNPVRGLAIDYGLRYEYNRIPGTLPQHPLNFSPRLGVAWSPNSAWVLRGGFGIFYGRYQLAMINRLLEWNGANAFVQVAESPGATALYRAGVPVTAPVAGIAPDIWKAQGSLANPYSEVASFGIERLLPSQWTVKLDYQFVHGVRLGRAANVNLLPPTILNARNASSLGVLAPTPQQFGRAVFSGGRSDPGYDAINQFATEADSGYNGLTLAVNRQFTEQFELLAGYTFSKTMDDASYDTENPQNPYDLAADRALSLQNQRHRLTLSGLWVVGPDLDDPQDRARAAHPGALMKAVTGLEFAPIVSAYTGFRANPLTGVDSNLEHIFPFAARPRALGRNSLETAPNVDFDLRVLKMVPIWRGHLDIVAESFNLLNHPNISLLNTAFGSGSRPQPFFGAPTETQNARRIQFSLDFEY